MNRFALIWIEWNNYNGFIFSLFEIELYKPINIDGSLFGICASKNFLYLHILFMTITIFESYDHDKF